MIEEKNVENLCFDYDEYFPSLLSTKNKIKKHL